MMFWKIQENIMYANVEIHGNFGFRCCKKGKEIEAHVGKARMYVINLIDTLRLDTL